MTRVDSCGVEFQPGQAFRGAYNLEREKDMELNTLMQALVRDLAEQLRPMVRDMIRQELVNGQLDMAVIAQNVNLAELAGELIPAQLRVIGEGVSLSNLAAELSPSDLISNVDWSEVLDYSDLASEVDLSDLADEISMERLTDAIDLNDKIRDYMHDMTFSIREA